MSTLTRSCLLICCLFTGCGLQEEMQPMIAYERGLYEMRNGNAEAALEAYKLAAQGMPDDPLLLYDTAIALEQLGQDREALQLYSKCIQTDSDFDRAYNNRAVIYLRTGQFEQAIEDCTQAIKINRANPLPYQNRGRALSELGEQLRAIEDFSMSIKLSEVPMPEALLSRADSLLQLHDDMTALRDVNEALEIDDQIAAAHLLKGVILRRQNRLKEAEDSFQNAKHIDPEIEIPAQLKVVARKPNLQHATLNESLLAYLIQKGYQQITTSDDDRFSYQAILNVEPVMILVKEQTADQNFRLTEAELSAIKEHNVSLVVLGYNEAGAPQVERHQENWKPVTDKLQPLEYVYPVR